MTDHYKTPGRVPANLVGTEADVSRDLRARVRAYVDGGPWQPFAEEYVEPRGLIVLAGPAPALTSGVHTRVHRPLQLLLDEVIAERLPPGREDEAVQASLATATGVLGLLAPGNQMLVYPAERHRPIVDAVIAFWPEFEALGERFTLGLTEGQRLGALPTNLGFLLARLGAPREALSGPLPPEGPAALLGQAGGAS